MDGVRPDPAFDVLVTDLDVLAATRRIFAAYLEAWAGPDSDVAGAEAIFGELVGAAVRHASHPVRVRLVWKEGRRGLLEIEAKPPYDSARVPIPSPNLTTTMRGAVIVHAHGGALEIQQRGATPVTVVEIPVRRREEPPPPP